MKTLKFKSFKTNVNKKRIIKGILKAQFAKVKIKEDNLCIKIFKIFKIFELIFLYENVKIQKFQNKC